VNERSVAVDDDDDTRAIVGSFYPLSASLFVVVPPRTLASWISSRSNRAVQDEAERQIEIPSKQASQQARDQAEATRQQQ